jgi:hypothetical protein
MFAFGLRSDFVYIRSNILGMFGEYWGVEAKYSNKILGAFRANSWPIPTMQAARAATGGREAVID